MLSDSGNVSSVYLLDIVIYIIKMMHTYNYICVFQLSIFSKSNLLTNRKYRNKKSFQTVVYSIIHNSVLPNVNLVTYLLEIFFKSN